MISSIEDFQESVAFELFVLDRTRPLLDHVGDELDLREAVINHSTMFVSSISEPVNAVKDQLAPLLFGAAWKVLDLLLELALTSDGIPSKSPQKWAIDEKGSYARQGKGQRALLGCSEVVWEVLLKLYAVTIEHRHCLIHRTANVDVTTLDLNGLSPKNRQLKTLTLENQVSFAQIGSLVGRAVIAGGLTGRENDHLQSLLDTMIAHTEAPTLSEFRVSAPVRIRLRLEKTEQGHFLDMTRFQEQTMLRFPSHNHFDLLIDSDDGSGRTLVAAAEEVPQGKMPINLDALPSWLSFG